MLIRRCCTINILIVQSLPHSGASKKMIIFYNKSGSFQIYCMDETLTKSSPKMMEGGPMLLQQNTYRTRPCSHHTGTDF
jgi:hypothetical protein